MPKDWLRLTSPFLLTETCQVSQTCQVCRKGKCLTNRSQSTVRSPRGCAISCLPTRPRCGAWRPACRATWTSWGYREIILPTFEYAATLSTDVGAGLDAEMYRFFDRHGRTLALRPDMTIPTARVVGTRLYDQPKPLRLSYIGSVFRYEPPRAGRQHEFIQAGVELMGTRGATADAESIALAVAALVPIGLPAFRITLGHVGFFRGLLLALAAPERLAARLRSAVDRKAEAELGALLQEVPRPAPGVREAALALRA